MASEHQSSAISPEVQARAKELANTLHLRLCPREWLEPILAAAFDAERQQQRAATWQELRVRDVIIDLADHVHQTHRSSWDQSFTECAAILCRRVTAVLTALDAAVPGVRADTCQSMIQPLDASCDNVLAWRLGEIAGDLDQQDVGDPIDRGLILLRLLRVGGFSVVPMVAREDKP